MGIAGLLTALARPLIGRPLALPPALLQRHPELAGANWRLGGLPVRVGGWCLGQPTVSGITLWRTIWLARDLNPPLELLLHELRHVHQFEANAAFPLLYLWESLRRGYVNNRYEVDARAYAADRVREMSEPHPERMR
jgi:hypothetical protein